MIARVLPVLVLLAAAPAPEFDPFPVAMTGRSGPDAVEAPPADIELVAATWSTRPRWEILHGLAARLLRGEAKEWFEKKGEATEVAPIPARFPEGFEAGKVEVADRLAGRVPADAAAVFFGSLEEAEKAVDELSVFLPRALPGLVADGPGGRRDALARAVAELLVPTIWRSNPGVRRGTRQAALLAADPDLRWDPEIALVVEVDDASLVRFHRLSTLSFEDRGARRLRLDGLDAVSDDGSVRSFFGLEGGIAVWSTGKSFRDRILAAAAGRAPTLLDPDPRAYALARRTFPASEGGALLVIPDGFLERIHSFALRDRRAAALRCDAVRMLLAARGLGKAVTPLAAGVRLECPAGGRVRIAQGSAEATCTVHGTTCHRVPLGDLPTGGGVAPPEGVVLGVFAGFPVAGAWRKGRLELLLPRGFAGDLLATKLSAWRDPPMDAGWADRVARRLGSIRAAGVPEAKAVAAYESIFGETPPSPSDRSTDSFTVWMGKSPGNLVQISVETR